MQMNFNNKDKERKVQEFFLAMAPPTATHQQVQVNFKTKSFYEPDNVKEARALFMERLSPFTPKEKFRGPIRLCVKWCFPMIDGANDGQYKDTKPDLDNSQKLLQDCMTKVGFWKDDSQVASLVLEKFWADIPGIYIWIEELG